MIQRKHCRPSADTGSGSVSIRFLNGDGRSASSRSRPGIAMRTSVTSLATESVDDEFESDNDDVTSLETLDSELTDAEYAESDDLLRMQNRQAAVLSNEEFATHAGNMEHNRGRLTNLLIDSEFGLEVLAQAFIDGLAKGADLSELINKNNSEVGGECAQFYEAEPDAVKPLELGLETCFRQILESEASVGAEDGVANSRKLLKEIHFLPSFLQQSVAVVLKRARLETALNVDARWLNLIRQRHLRMTEARQAMINGNLRLVTFVVKQYKHQAMSFSDLIQDGTIGLIKAVDRYDLSRGVRFSTYAIYWIRQTITRAMVRQDKMVRLPYNMAAKASFVFETMNNHLMRHNKWPEHHELAALCGLSVEDVKAIVENYQPVLSLDSNINGDDDMPEMITMLEQNHFPQPLNSLVSNSLKTFLRMAVGNLPQREADIIKYRFGLENDHEMTLQDIAERMSLTRERVRQIQNSALMKLKHGFSRELVDYLEPG